MVITDAVDEKINEALRAHLRLLTPGQIRKGLETLGLQQQELAEQLGVAKETISRWLNGALIQSRAMDNLLRVFFALPAVRSVLRGPDQDPQLGTEVDRLAGQAAGSPQGNPARTSPAAAGSRRRKRKGT
jgi:transcriptional regulator with XRE-family HTH domain